MPSIGGFIAPPMLRPPSFNSVYSMPPAVGRHRFPAEDLRVERRRPGTSGVISSSHDNVPCSFTSDAPMLFFACQRHSIAPVGSAITDMRPASITSNGGIITVPPAPGDLRGGRVDVGDGHVRVPVRRDTGHRAAARSRRRASRSSSPSNRPLRCRRRRGRPAGRRTPSRTARCRTSSRRPGRRSGGRPSSACRARTCVRSGMAAPRSDLRTAEDRGIARQRTGSPRAPKRAELVGSGRAPASAPVVARTTGKPPRSTAAGRPPCPTPPKRPEPFGSVLFTAFVIMSLRFDSILVASSCGR